MHVHIQSVYFCYIVELKSSPSYKFQYLKYCYQRNYTNFLNHDHRYHDSYGICKCKLYCNYVRFDKRKN